jgi:hypothetical protein
MYERCSEVQTSRSRRCVLDEGHGGLHSTIIRPTSPLRYIERARMDGCKLPKARHRVYCKLDLDHIGRCQTRYMSLLGLKESPSKPNYSGDSIATEPVGNSVPVSPATGLWTYYQWSFGVVRPRTPQTPSTDGAVVGTDGLMYELPSQVGYCHTKWHTIEPHEMNNNCQGWQPKKKSIGSFYL